MQRNIAVTPVLLQDARMPSVESLPDDLKELAYRNGFELSHSRWESDVHELVRRLGLAPAAKPTSAAVAADVPPAPLTVAASARARPSTAITLGAVGVVVAAALLGWMATRGDRAATAPAPAPAPTPSPEARATPQPSRADVENLLVQINDESDARRHEAADRLRRDFAHSSFAVGLAVNQLSAANFQKLNKEGRIELLGFLLAADDAAWTVDRRVEAADALRRIRQRVASGNAHLVPQVMDLVQQLGRRVGE